MEKMDHVNIWSTLPHSIRDECLFEYLLGWHLLIQLQQMPAMNNTNIDWVYSMNQNNINT